MAAPLKHVCGLSRSQYLLFCVRKSNLKVCNRTFLWRRKAKKSQEEEAEDERRKINPKSDGPDFVDRFQSLTKRKSIETVKGYKPPPDVETRLYFISENMYGTAADWKEIDLSDRLLKFKFLTRAMKEFDHDIPNMDLQEMNKISDVISFFNTEVRDTCTYDDLPKIPNLPKNLHLNVEPIRFDPDNDPLFGGKTAFPGHETKITSVRYRRKYGKHAKEDKDFSEEAEEE